jgi:hypothetical protein
VWEWRRARAGTRAPHIKALSSFHKLSTHTEHTQDAFTTVLLALIRPPTCPQHHYLSLHTPPLTGQLPYHHPHPHTQTTPFLTPTLTLPSLVPITDTAQYRVVQPALSGSELWDSGSMRECACGCACGCEWGTSESESVGIHHNDSDKRLYTMIKCKHRNKKYPTFYTDEEYKKEGKPPARSGSIPGSRAGARNAGKKSSPHCAYSMPAWW